MYDRRVLFASPSLAFVLTFVLTGGAPAPAIAQPAPPRGLTFPREDPGACPFECCKYGRWVASAAVTVRRERLAGAAPAFSVAPGETVDAITGVVVTTQPGRARVLAALTLDGLTLAAGEEVSVLRYAGEGAYLVCARGRAVEAESEEAGGHLRVLSTPRVVWWVQIRNARGEVGWSDQPDRFTGRDGCG